MRIIHLLRKPLSEGTVASNVLKHGCGGLNIDASRVGSGLHIQAAAGGIGDGNIYGTADEYVLGRGRDYRVGGRWPANVVLQHLDGCRCDGVKRVKGTVADWVCEPGCPVARLDEQSGDRSSPWVGNPNRGKKGGQMFGGQTDNLSDLSKPEYRDTGGASRFYKQVGGEIQKYLRQSRFF